MVVLNMLMFPNNCHWIHIIPGLPRDKYNKPYQWFVGRGGMDTTGQFHIRVNLTMKKWSNTFHKKITKYCIIRMYILDCLLNLTPKLLFENFFPSETGYHKKEIKKLKIHRIAWFLEEASRPFFFTHNNCNTSTLEI